MATMCNLSQGIKEEGRLEGHQEGRLEGSIARAIENAKNFLNMGFSPEQVAKGTGLTLEEVMQLKEQMQ